MCGALSQGGVGAVMLLTVVDVHKSLLSLRSQSCAFSGSENGVSVCVVSLDVT